MSAPRNIVCEQNEVNMELAFAAVATYPTLDQASESLKVAHGVMCSPAKLEVLGRLNPERLAKARDQVAQIKEANLKAGLGDIAELSSIATKAAIVRATERLDEVFDPEKAAKIARDLSQVTAQSVDKKALLEGKPTQIVEKRSTEEILRALEQKGIVSRPELDIPDAEVVDD